MPKVKKIQMLFGKDGLDIEVPLSTTVLKGQDIPALANPVEAIFQALANPIASPSLADLVKNKSPKTVAITVSDITRPVLNKLFLPTMIEVLNGAGIADSQIVIIIGTGMHRSNNDSECQEIVGQDLLRRIEVINHRADDAKTLIRISDKPPISICRRFANADFRIVTGYIEPHFMAGFSGGRKGICPALVDLETIQHFHGYKTLTDPAADTGNIKNNPCHKIALDVAMKVGVDFLFNVAITHDRRIAAIYCGHLEQAHLDGCRQVAKWSTAFFDEPFDFVITSGGGFPLDQTFYQTIKGMCTALPALKESSTLLQISHCQEKLGSPSYTDLMIQYKNNWRRFLSDIQAGGHMFRLDQWQYQMQTKVLSRIGVNKLWFVSDGIPYEIQKYLSVKPILGKGNVRERAQHTIQKYIDTNPNARIAIIPEGPYTMLSRNHKDSVVEKI